MKKCLFLILFSIYGINASAQGRQTQFRLNVYGLYTFEDEVESYYSDFDYYKGRLEDGPMFGGGAEVMLRPNFGVELSYLRMNTEAPLTYIGGFWGENVQFTNYKLHLNYAMLGSNYYFDTKSIMEPFVGGMLGFAFYSIENPVTFTVDDDSKFAWGFKAGTNINVAKFLALKLMGQVTSINQGVGGGLYFGSNGIGTGLNTFSTVFQLSLGGGIVFKIGASDED